MNSFLQGLDNYRLDVLASDVKGAVEALGHSSCTLVAHDWGGAVAWVTAGMFGQELVKQLIVMGLPHMGISSTNMGWQQSIKSLYMLNFQVRCFMGNASLPWDMTVWHTRGQLAGQFVAFVLSCCFQ